MTFSWRADRARRAFARELRVRPVELRRKPSAGCGDLIRESVRVAGTRGTIAALVDRHSRGRVCAGGGLEVSDAELAATYAQCAKREPYPVRRALPAEMLIDLSLMDG